MESRMDRESKMAQNLDEFFVELSKRREKGGLFYPSDFQKWDCIAGSVCCIIAADRFEDGRNVNRTSGPEG